MGTAEGPAGGRTWLVVAAERREFDGILKRCGPPANLDWAAEFACEVGWNGDRWLLIANGPGPKLVEQALAKRVEVAGIISAGFCGALDPELRVGDVVRDRIHSSDRVAVTASEKSSLREKTGAAAVDMESAAIAQKAAEWGVPFFMVRAVSDRASEDMPLDFNEYRDAAGRFSRARIALAALTRPFTAIPALLRLDRNCRIAAESLGDFFADCRL
jgi:adenosylhomocysteine nucleosidase